MTYKKTITINYSWNIPGRLPPGAAEQLDRDAGERVNEMTAEGFTEGELATTLYGPDGEMCEVYGWWNVKKT